MGKAGWASAVLGRMEGLGRVKHGSLLLQIGQFQSLCGQLGHRKSSGSLESKGKGGICESAPPPILGPASPGGQLLHPTLQPYTVPHPSHLPASSISSKAWAPLPAKLPVPLQTPVAAPRPIEVQSILQDSCRNSFLKSISNGGVGWRG